MSASAFDRERTLAELLPEALRARLEQCLGPLCGGPTVLVNTAGQVLWGAPSPDLDAAVPVRGELEPLGWLRGSSARAAQLRAGAALLEMILRERLRYDMAASLHTEVSAADFARVQASEARYRALSEELQARVDEQVEILSSRQRQLYQSERLASVGRLAAGVAHEVNNPLGFVRSNLSSFSKYLEALRRFRQALEAGEADLPGRWRALDLPFVLEDLGDLLRDSVGGLDRIARIVADLKGFSNVDQPEEAVADLNEHLQRVCAMVEGMLPAGAQLEQALAPLPKILCLPGHLNQVFLNVLSNAVQAIGPGGTVTVSSSAAGDAVRIEVADDGCGIAPEHLEHVFEPFFTTRPVGAGTGLGLTVARDIVEAHDGRIGIRSTPGAGTVVSIELPA